MCRMTTIHYIGASWCATCKVIKPKTEELAKKYGVGLTCFDYDKDLDEEEQAKISKVPTLRIFKESTLVAEFSVAQVVSLEHWLMSNVVLSTADDF